MIIRGQGEKGDFSQTTRCRTDDHSQKLEPEWLDPCDDEKGRGSHDHCCGHKIRVRNDAEEIRENGLYSHARNDVGEENGALSDIFISKDVCSCRKENDIGDIIDQT